MRWARVEMRICTLRYLERRMTLRLRIMRVQRLSRLIVSFKWTMRLPSASLQSTAAKASYVNCKTMLFQLTCHMMNRLSYLRLSFGRNKNDYTDTWIYNKNCVQYRRIRIPRMWTNQSTNVSTQWQYSHERCKSIFARERVFVHSFFDSTLLYPSRSIFIPFAPR